MMDAKTVSDLRALVAAGSALPWVAYAGGVIETDGVDLVTPAWRDADRALVVAAVNALPSLLSESESLRAELARVRTSILAMQAKRANVHDVSEGWIARTALCEHRMDTEHANLWNVAIRASAALAPPPQESK
jgi:hypothetical protein